jgi:hypothetical protein
MVSAGAPRAPVFISAPDFSCSKQPAEHMLRSRKRGRPLPESLFQTMARVARSTFPSPELPTFTRLYPSIVTRRVSQ